MKNFSKKTNYSQVSQNETFQVQEQYPDHHFRTEIPNIIFDLGLDPYALSVYCHLKRIAGDCGSCWRSISSLCELTKMGETKLNQCLDYLSSPSPEFNEPLITVTKRFKQDRSKDTHLIEILPIWKKNGDHYRNLKKEPGGGGGSPREGGVARHAREGGSPREDKEEHSKKEPFKETNKQESGGSVVVCSFENEKRAILSSCGFDAKLIDHFMSVAIHIIKDAISAFQQYKTKQEESGAKLDNPTGTLRKAIEQKWKPNITKVEQETQKEQKQQKTQDLIEENRQFAADLEIQHMNSFNEKFNFSVSSNTVCIKNGNGYTPLSLVDPEFRKILKNYVQNRGF